MDGVSNEGVLKRLKERTLLETAEKEKKVTALEIQLEEKEC